MSFELDTPKKGGVNLHASTNCVVCSGNRFVVVAIRPANAIDVPGFEEYAPCPSCNASTTTQEPA